MSFGGDARSSSGSRGCTSSSFDAAHGSVGTIRRRRYIRTVCAGRQLWQSDKAHDALRTLARLKECQHAAFAFKVAGFGYREIQTLRGVTDTNASRHVSEGRAAARRCAVRRRALPAHAPPDGRVIRQTACSTYGVG